MKRFNTTGTCFPEDHYMVDLTERIKEIRRMVERGQYFCIHRGRQYGKTTTLEALRVSLQDDYVVFSLSFEGIGNKPFEAEATLVKSFWGLLEQQVKYGLVQSLCPATADFINANASMKTEELSLELFSAQISELCGSSEKKVVLIIDEVDQASNYEAFLKLLGVLRSKYLARKQLPTFLSVILAGVYNIKNLKLKIGNSAGHPYNSPWNIAENLNVEMELSENGIAAMLGEYEGEHHTGMDIAGMAKRLSDYTHGYPFLVSRLCQIMDEDLQGKDGFRTLAACWTKEGFLAAEKLLLKENNTLFDDMLKQLAEQPGLREMLRGILCHGVEFSFVGKDAVIELGRMFGFIRDDNGRVAVANVIFETVLYDVFTSEARRQMSTEASLSLGSSGRYVVDGHLDMAYVLERFAQVYPQLYDGSPFLEKDGRCLFLFFLKPIINGTGHYYVEPQTRDECRMDIVVNYAAEQFIIELKIWRGEAYHEDGVEQLCGYLDKMGERRGYLLTFNFRQKKSTGVQTIQADGKTIIEAMV